MKSTALLGILSLIMLTAFYPGNLPENKSDTLFVDKENLSFIPGEKLYYRMNYSIFTVGRAEIIVNPIKYQVSNKLHYKIDIYGRTAGAAAIVSTVNDNWGALIDSDDLLPLRSWRNIEEGRFRRKEIVDFNHEDGKIDVHVLNYKTGKLKETVNYDFEEPYMLDLISGYAFLRNIDYQQYNMGDTIRINGFLEDTFYDFKIVYKGKEEIKTRLGYIMTHKLVPVMPDNKIFSGENSVTAWFAADDSGILVKIDANMFIGRAGCEITSYEGIKKKPRFYE